MNLQFKEIAQRHGNPLTISRAEMQEAITAVAIVESDAEVRKSCDTTVARCLSRTGSQVLDRLFTMFDKTGDDAIYYREFTAGSPLSAF